LVSKKNEPFKDIHGYNDVIEKAGVSTARNCLTKLIIAREPLNYTVTGMIIITDMAGIA